MRYILISILLFVNICCGKLVQENELASENKLVSERRSVSNYTFTLAQSNHITLSKGVSSTMEVQKLGNESGRSCWISCYIGDVFVQLGYDSKARYLFQYYYGTLDNIQIINPAPVIREREKNTFAIRNVQGLKWETIVNGQTILTFEASTDVCWRIRTGIEYGGSNQRFPQINFNPAFLLWDGETWEVPTGAIVSHRGKWGIKSDTVNNIDMGGGIKLDTTFTLW